MASIRVRLTFPEALIKEPVIYNLGKNLDIVTNIRRANVEQRKGWVILEMSADAETLKKGIEYLESKGVEVKTIDGDIVEG
jgi:ABC-type methionine transport system ATPase subunit